MKMFDMVIMPLLTCSSIINIKLTKTQSDKLLSLERRASRIIGKKVKFIECIIKKRTINMVFTVLMDDSICESFNDYFNINYHAKNTRKRNKLLKLPRVKLEFAKRSFKYMGAILYNDLPKIYVPVRMIKILENYLMIMLFKLLNFSLCVYL